MKPYAKRKSRNLRVRNATRRFGPSFEPYETVRVVRRRNLRVENRTRSSGPRIFTFEPQRQARGSPTWTWHASRYAGDVRQLARSDAQGYPSPWPRRRWNRPGTTRRRNEHPAGGSGPSTEQPPRLGSTIPGSSGYKLPLRACFASALWRQTAAVAPLSAAASDDGGYPRRPRRHMGEGQLSLTRRGRDGPQGCPATPSVAGKRAPRAPRRGGCRWENGSSSTHLDRRGVVPAAEPVVPTGGGRQATTGRARPCSHDVAGRTGEGTGRGHRAGSTRAGGRVKVQP
jgi:hypothetical protein